MISASQSLLSDSKSLETTRVSHQLLPDDHWFTQFLRLQSLLLTSELCPMSINTNAIGRAHYICNAWKHSWWQMKMVPCMASMTASKFLCGSQLVLSMLQLSSHRVEHTSLFSQTNRLCKSNCNLGGPVAPRFSALYAQAVYVTENSWGVTWPVSWCTFCRTVIRSCTDMRSRNHFWMAVWRWKRFPKSGTKRWRNIWAWPPKMTARDACKTW